MPGYLATCPMNAVRVEICSIPFSCGHGIVQCSPSLCTVHFSFPSIRSALYPTPSFTVPDPPFSPLFLLLLVTRPPSRLPRRADLLYSPLFPPPPLTQGAQHVQFISTPVCCFPSPFATISNLGPCSSSSSPSTSILQSEQSYKIHSTL